MRFPEFKENLFYSSLGSIFSISAGGDIDKTRVSELQDNKHPYPVIANALTKEGIYGYTDTWKQESCVTVTGRGDIGIAKARNYKYFPIVRLLSLKPLKESNLKYFEALINSKTILDESTGVPQLTSPQISKIKIAYCSFPEQNKIGRFLDLLDERINTQNKIIEELNALKNGIKPTDFGTSTLSDIAICNSSSLSLNAVNNMGIYPVYGANGLCGYCDKYQFNSDGVAIIKDGTGVGRIYKIRDSHYSIIGTLNLIQPKNISLDFLFFSLNAISFRKYTVGSGIPHIYFEDYKKENIPCCNNKNNFLSDFLVLIEKKMENESKILNAYTEQKQFLLNNMFI